MKLERFADVVVDEARRLKRRYPLKDRYYQAIIDVFQAVRERAGVNDYDILVLLEIRRLEVYNGGQPAPTAQIAASLNKEAATMRYHLRKNKNRGYLHHPDGIKGGWALTEAALEFLQELEAKAA